MTLGFYPIAQKETLEQTDRRRCLNTKCWLECRFRKLFLEKNL